MAEEESQARLMQNGLTGRWYTITRWHREDKQIVSDEKHDVTDDVIQMQGKLILDFSEELAGMLEEMGAQEAAQVARDLGGSKQVAGGERKMPDSR